MEESDDINRFQAKLIPEDDPAQSLFAEEQFEIIRYIDIECALIPGWRARINEITLRDAMSRTPTWIIPPRPSKGLEAPPKTDFLCRLLLHHLSGLRSRSRRPSADHKDKTTTSSDSASRIRHFSTPSYITIMASIYLALSVSSKEIQSLRELTVGDVLTGVYHALHEPIPSEEHEAFAPEQEAKLFERAAPKRVPRMVSLMGLLSTPTSWQMSRCWNGLL